MSTGRPYEKDNRKRSVIMATVIVLMH